MTMTMISFTFLQPKGRIAEQGYVNAVVKQFIITICTQYKKTETQKQSPYSESVSVSPPGKRLLANFCRTDENAILFDF